MRWPLLGELRGMPAWFWGQGGISKLYQPYSNWHSHLFYTLYLAVSRSTCHEFSCPWKCQAKLLQDSSSEAADELRGFWLLQRQVLATVTCLHQQDAAEFCRQIILSGSCMSWQLPYNLAWCCSEINVSLLHPGNYWCCQPFNPCKIQPFLVIWHFCTWTFMKWRCSYTCELTINVKILLDINITICDVQCLGSGCTGNLSWVIRINP